MMKKPRCNICKFRFRCATSTPLSPKDFPVSCPSCGLPIYATELEFTNCPRYFVLTERTRRAARKIDCKCEGFFDWEVKET